MQANDGVRKLIEVFKVANDDMIGNVARQIFNLKWKEGLSARNQAHKILEQLALTNQIQKGKGYFATRNYVGQWKAHDRLVSEIISRLILFRLPISIYREVSHPVVGLRSDIATLIAKGGRATAALIEVCNNESDSYLAQKVVALRNWKGANEALSNLFNAPIPHFSLVVYGKSHPEAMDFEQFIKEVVL